MQTIYKSSVLGEIKQHTIALHSKLETTIISKKIIAPQVTAADYGTYLLKMYTIHYAVENYVFPLLESIIPAIHNRHKSSYIKNDLQKVGFLVQPQTIDFITAQQVLTPAFAMGTMYVTEGSMLGAQYILKNIEKNLSPQLTDATTFLNAYAENTRTLWLTFTGCLEQFCESQPLAEVKAGAVYAFEKTYAIFSL